MAFQKPEYQHLGEPANPTGKGEAVEGIAFRDLRRQYEALKADIDRALVGTAGGGAYIMGPEVKALESELAGYTGVRHCLTCANGTDALTLALKVWNIGPGDAVFVPDFTFFASAEVVALEGATPVFVDVCEDTFNMDPDDLERAVTETLAEGRLCPKAIIAVDLFGLPADYPHIRAVAQRHGLRVLEDGAQGFGGRIGNRCACSFGDISTTSFFPAKPLGCYGDGGAVFTDNNQWAERIASLRVHGKGSDKYDNVRIGMNSRLDTIQAAVLRVKLKAFKEFELDAVEEVARRYGERLAGGIPVIPEGFRSSWAQYTIRLRDREERDGLQAFLKSEGIPSMVYYPRPMHLQTAFAPADPTLCPVATSLCQRVLSLPMHPYLSENDIDKICDAVRRGTK